jgi:hypothetical protein
MAASRRAKLRRQMEIRRNGQKLQCRSRRQSGRTRQDHDGRGTRGDPERATRRCPPRVASVRISNGTTRNTLRPPWKTSQGQQSCPWCRGVMERWEHHGTNRENLCRALFMLCCRFEQLDTVERQCGGESVSQRPLIYKLFFNPAHDDLRSPSYRVNDPGVLTARHSDRYPPATRRLLLGSLASR